MKGVPDLLRAVDPSERVLMAQKLGPQTLHALSATIGMTEPHLWKLIDKLHHAGHVRRIGARHTSHWALHSYRGRQTPPGPPRADKKKHGDTTTRPARSWWLVDPADFHTAAQQRAGAMHWSDDDEETDDEGIDDRTLES